MKDKVERGKLTNEIKLLRKEIRDREQVELSLAQ